MKEVEEMNYLAALGLLAVGWFTGIATAYYLGARYARQLDDPHRNS